MKLFRLLRRSLEILDRHRWMGLEITRIVGSSYRWQVFLSVRVDSLTIGRVPWLPSWDFLELVFFRRIIQWNFSKRRQKAIYAKATKNTFEVKFSSKES